MIEVVGELPNGWLVLWSLDSLVQGPPMESKPKFPLGAIGEER